MKKILYLIFIILNYSCMSQDYQNESLPNLSKKEILNYLDKFIYQENNGNFFIELANPDHQTTFSRMYLFRGEGEWLIVNESYGYTPSQNEFCRMKVYIGKCNIYNNLIKKNINGNLEFDSGIIDFEEMDKNGIIEYFTPKVSEASEIKKDSILSLKDNLSSLRYLFDNNSIKLDADLIKSCEETGLKYVMVIDEWYHEEFNLYEEENEKNLPSKSETFQMIAAILETGNTELWKPTKKVNSHWSNWLQDYYMY